MPVTNYFWDPLQDNVTKEYDDEGDTIVRYATEPDLYGNLISQERDGVASYHHFDGQGSALALTNKDGDVTDEYDYNAFGETTDGSGTTVNTRRYIGESGYEYEPATLAYCVRMRPYEPRNARWLCLDQAVGFYVYSMNSPAMHADPSGLQPDIDQQPKKKESPHKGIFKVNIRYKKGPGRDGREFDGRPRPLDDCDCGGMTSLIEFEVVDIGKRDIVVIQYVDTEIEIFDCDGNAVFTDLKKKEGHPFYEAWEFPKSEWNEDGTAKEGGTSSGMDDAFSGPCRLIEEGCPPAKKKTKGKEKIIGAFVGYFDYKLPASYKLNQFESARLLKTSKEPPADWNAAAVWTMHRVVWEWDCCADPPKTTSIVIHDPK